MQHLWPGSAAAAQGRERLPRTAATDALPASTAASGRRPGARFLSCSCAPGLRWAGAATAVGENQKMLPPIWAFSFSYCSQYVYRMVTASRMPVPAARARAESA